ncbi:MAG: DUF2917 domain-containing protein [Dechloromonas sp.]|nr:DUF2917 domain-containing protein [Dechloromonas sp.]
MNSHRVLREVDLPQDHPIRLQDAAGTRVRCLRGTIWITVASEPDDIFLSTGQSYLIPRNGLSLVELLDGGSIELERQRPFGKLREWLDGLVRRMSKELVL